MKKEIIEWLHHIEKQDGIPPKDVIAFNFGLLEEDKGYVMYLVGVFEYTEENDDWACVEMPTKEYRYLRLTSDLQKHTWEDVLSSIAKILSDLEKEGELNITLVKNAKAITTGFDEGELIKIR